jgi:hypothetical protein
MEHRLSAAALHIGWIDRLLTALSITMLALIGGAYLSLATRLPIFVTGPSLLAILAIWRTRRIRRAKAEMSRLSIRVHDAQLVFIDKNGRENVLRRSEVTRITRDETGHISIYTGHETSTFEFSERHFVGGSDLVDALERWLPIENVSSRWVWVPPSSITGGLLAIVLAIVLLASDPMTISLGVFGLCVMTFLAIKFTRRQRVYPRNSCRAGGA